MVNIKNKAAKAMLAREEMHSVGVRENIARQMEASGYGAILWGDSVFGSTNYPLVSTTGGRAYNVHGLRLNPDGSVCAIIAYPAGGEVTGIRTYTPQEADRVISPAQQMCAGSPEEWDILGDCFATAMQVEKAETREEQPLPWW